MKSFWKRYARNRGAVIGLVILSIIVLVAILVSVLFPQSPWKMVGLPRQPPGTPGLPFGTDVLGRDVAVAVAYGARVSIFVGIVATSVALSVGVTLGSIAGYFGGRVEEAIVRFTEIFQVIPNLVLLMVLVALLTPSLTSTIIGIGTVTWPAVARVVRAEFLSLRTREFVEAAHVLGESNLKILVTQILPNSLPPDHRHRLTDGGDRDSCRVGTKLPRPRRPQSDDLGLYDRCRPLGIEERLVDKLLPRCCDHFDSTLD